jgi:hypothetical protein
VEEINRAADTAWGGQVVHAQTVEQVAAPAAEHQGAGPNHGGRTATADQDSDGEAQQPKVQQVSSAPGTGSVYHLSTVRPTRGSPPGLMTAPEAWRQAHHLVA